MIIYIAQESQTIQNSSTPTHALKHTYTQTFYSEMKNRSEEDEATTKKQIREKNKKNHLEMSAPHTHTHMKQKTTKNRHRNRIPRIQKTNEQFKRNYYSVTLARPAK